MKKQAIFSKVKGIFAKTREWIIKHKGISSFLLGLVVGLWFIPWVITMASTGTPKSLIELVRNTSYGDSTLIQQKKVPYTLTATFAKAVLDTAKQDKTLVVYVQKVAVPFEAKKDGLFGWDVYKQSKYMIFHGLGRYSVNLAQIHDRDIVVHEDTKTIDIYIPEPELSVEFLPEDTEFLNTSNGMLRFGSMEITPEMMSDLETNGKQKIRDSIEADPDSLSTAETYAKLSVKEIVEPVLKKQINADAERNSDEIEAPQYYTINVLIKGKMESQTEAD